METYEILHDLNIDCSPSMLYDAISIPGKLENWWPQTCTGKPELRAKYHFDFGPAYQWMGEVCEITPNSLFAIEMLDCDDDWMHTIFRFRISATDEGCRLTFEHEGWKSNESHFRHTSFCWALLLKGLKDYCENGTVIPFSQRA